ncbi:hypothetical protein PVAND_014526 [Polypedilum vanderplanki]|uniref:Peptidase S1 domain-containing protein n=1 Tax=Polypedilum vanderplanki TaxID=319348 RepID=A0A9J6BA59_POLVA|nr:hypothetical protein PVAND_014526 [Polypedilum vanderplanki]
MKRFLAILLIFGLAINYSCSAATTFIVGGKYAENGQFPYMVSLGNVNFPGSHGCGGGILNQRWILSAAHCFIQTPPNVVIARVGNVERMKGVTYKIIKIVQHPRFIRNIPPVYVSNWHDIAVIKTDVPIVYNEFVQPIAIGHRHIIGNIQATVAGFGAFDPSIDLNFPLEDLVMADRLKYIETQIITFNDCSRRANIFNTINPFYLNLFVHPTSHICTLQPRGIGVCFGDSGSMLIANGVVVGVTASGIRLCAQAHAAPDIFARVSTYAVWVENEIQDLN